MNRYKLHYFKRPPWPKQPDIGDFVLWEDNSFEVTSYDLSMKHCGPILCGKTKDGESTTRLSLTNYKLIQYTPTRIWDFNHYE